MWIVGPDQGDTTPDWVITNHGIDSPDSIASVVSQTFSTLAGATKSTRPYLFALSGSKVFMFAVDAALTRKYYDELNGQGAIVGGTLQYFGELG